MWRSREEAALPPPDCPTRTHRPCRVCRQQLLSAASPGARLTHGAGGRLCGLRFSLVLLELTLSPSPDHTRCYICSSICLMTVLSYFTGAISPDRLHKLDSRLNFTHSASTHHSPLLRAGFHKRAACIETEGDVSDLLARPHTRLC